MLGITNPNLVSVDEIRNRSTIAGNKTECTFCGRSHGKRDCPAFGKECHKCGRKKTTLAKCVNPFRDLTSLSQSMTQES